MPSEAVMNIMMLVQSTPSPWILMFIGRLVHNSQWPNAAQRLHGKKCKHSVMCKYLT